MDGSTSSRNLLGEVSLGRVSVSVSRLPTTQQGRKVQATADSMGVREHLGATADSAKSL